MYILKRNLLPPRISSGLGTIAYNPILSLPVLPDILAEWTSLIPLVSHLASYQHDHEIVGITSLTARINISLFPRLGVLMGYTRLLNGGPDFLDRVSTIGEVSLWVWDVNWGSTFPCANGSASQMITNYALRGLKSKFIEMPESAPEVIQEQTPGKLKPDAPQSSRVQNSVRGELSKAELHTKKAGFNAFHDFAHI